MNAVQKAITVPRHMFTLNT